MNKENNKNIQRALLDIKSGSFSMTYTPGKDSDFFPAMLQSCGCFYADRDYFTERSGLESFLCIYTFGGCGRLRTAGQEVLLPGSSMVIIDCSEYQYYSTESDVSWDFKWLHFRGGMAEKYVSLINDGRPNVIKDKTGDILKQVDGIIEIASNRISYSDLVVSGSIVSLLNKITRMVLRSVSLEEKKICSGCIDETVMYIDSHLDEDLTLDTLAEMVHLSKYHFIRLFKSAKGLTPHEYITSCRIDMSKKMLRETDRKISDIALECGFTDTSGYIKAFKRLCKITPGAYRKEKGFPF